MSCAHAVLVVSLNTVTEANQMYKIVRQYFNDHTRSRTIETGLTLEQARAHCSNPETSSRTCTKSGPKRITKRNGPWFDSYTECTR